MLGKNNNNIQTWRVDSARATTRHALLKKKRDLLLEQRKTTNYMSQRETDFDQIIINSSTNEHQLEVSTTSNKNEQLFSKRFDLAPHNTKKRDSTNSSTQMTNIKNTSSPQRQEEIKAMKDCYRKILREDVSSLKILLTNRSEKPKAPLLTRYRNPNRGHLRRYLQHRNNQFPTKQPPYVPHSFMTFNRKRQISPTIELTQHNNNTKNNKNYNNRSCNDNSESIKSYIQFNTSAKTNNFTATKSKERRVRNKSPMLDQNSDCREKPELINSDDLTHLHNNINKFSEGNVQITSNNKLKSPQDENFNTKVIDDASPAQLPDPNIISSTDNDTTAPSTIPSVTNDGMDNKYEEKSSSTSLNGSLLTDENIAKTRMFQNCSIDLSVVDENGETKEIVWHEPGKENTEGQTFTTVLSPSPRKEELKQLLQEYVDIARKVNEIDLDEIT